MTDYSDKELFLGKGGVDMPTKVIAVVLDGEVVEIFRFDERISSILLSNPTFVDISNISVDNGWKFDGSDFSKNIDGGVVVVPASN